MAGVAKWFEGEGGVRLRADVAGEGREMVLFLHGGGQTRRSWDSAAAMVMASGRKAVSVDLRGHGESTWSPIGAYSIDAFVGDLRRIVEQLERLPTIVGASLGGLTAMTAIGEAKEPLATALVLVDVTPKLNLEGVERIRAFMRAKPEGFASLDEAAAAVSAYMPHRRARPSARGLEKNLRRNAATGLLQWRWDPKFLEDPQLSPENLWPRYEAAARALTLPTLLVRGAASDVVDDESAVTFKSLVPHALYFEVPDATHMVAGDQNDAFNQAVLEFLERGRLR